MGQEKTRRPRKKGTGESGEEEGSQSYHLVLVHPNKDRQVLQGLKFRLKARGT